jgi:hypothetical protein
MSSLPATIHEPKGDTVSAIVITGQARAMSSRLAEQLAAIPADGERILAERELQCGADGAVAPLEALSFDAP